MLCCHFTTEDHITKVPVVRYGDVYLTTFDRGFVVCSAVWSECYDRGDHDMSWAIRVDMVEYILDNMEGILDELLGLLYIRQLLM